MKLRFHKKLYPKAAITAAVEAFEGMAKAGKPEGDYAVVEVEPEDGADIQEVAGEFGNYVLGVSIALRGER